ncbi:hypothetical protein AWB69_00018 [Caballeronia udeis]|uniref:Uncharacterized protein n=1 Tax=Caballeronia udeis TaxID=1232866 RepID=A0A158EPA0_9BURK|nr:hypothetical protein [Caballeronia udeis]SAL09303.1 hypothetical protein AWB69_00018 [Caballeronia udeis]
MAVALKERVRLLEGRLVQPDTGGINFPRTDLIRNMIRTGRSYAELNAEERELHDDYVPLKKSLFDFSAADLLAKIRWPEAGASD